MADVFISYSPSELATARRLADILREANLSIWMDEQSLAPGADIASGLEQAIRGSRTVLVVLGKNTDSNSWVRTETAIALSQKDKRVIPILTVRNADIPFMLRHLQAVDLSSHDDFDSRARELAEYLKRTPATSPSDPAARYARVAAETDALRLEKLDYNRAKTSSNMSLIAGAATVLVLSLSLAVALILLKDKLDLSDHLISMLLGVFSGMAATYLYRSIKDRIRAKLSKLIRQDV